MSPSNDHRKWRQGIAFFTDLDIIQTAQQAERNELLAQPLLKKPPQDCSFSKEELWEMHNTVLRNVEESKKQEIKGEADRLTLQRLIKEHEDCITCSVCLTEHPPSPPLCPTEPPPHSPPQHQHQPYHQQVWESSVGNIKSLESFNRNDDSFSTYSSKSDSDKHDQDTTSTNNSNQEPRCSTPINSELDIASQSTALTPGAWPGVDPQADRSQTTPANRPLQGPQHLVKMSLHQTRRPTLIFHQQGKDGHLHGYQSSVPQPCQISFQFFRSIRNLFQTLTN